MSQLRIGGGGGDNGDDFWSSVAVVGVAGVHCSVPGKKSSSPGHTPEAAAMCFRITGRDWP